MKEDVEKQAFLIVISMISIVGGTKILITGHAGFRSAYASGPHINALALASITLGVGYLAYRLFARK